MTNLMKIIEMNKIQFVGVDSEMIFETLEDARNSGEIIKIYVWDEDFGWVLCGEF